MVTPIICFQIEDKNFLSKVVTEVCRIFQITRLHTSSYHPQTNATCERTNATIAQSIRALCDQHPNKWSSLLPGISAALRTVPSTESTLFSPFFILFKQECRKQECRMPIDTALRVGDIPSAAQPCMEEIVQNAELTKTMVTENIKTAQDRYNKHHDGKLPPPQYVVGQLVLLRCSHNLPGISGKLQQKYDGPYYITKALPHNVYILRLCSDNQALKSPVNAARLRPYWTPDDRPTNPLEGDTDPVQTNLKDIPNTTTDLPTDPSAQAPAKPTNHPSDAETHVLLVDDDVYLVDRLMACKTVNNVKHCKVKWTGYKETTCCYSR